MSVVVLTDDRAVSRIPAGRARAGYRHSRAAWPTTLITASTGSQAPLPVRVNAGVADLVRRSASRPPQHDMPIRRRARPDCAAAGTERLG
jgi:hypothetical protein